VEYTRLGRTGLKVSRIGLGCMSYGSAAAGMHKWTLDEGAAAPFFRQAVELGVTFWDTANVYQSGTSEEFVGRAISRFSRREDIVLATKVSGRMHDGPGGSGLSRKAILEQVDASLRRLGSDYNVLKREEERDMIPMCLDQGVGLTPYSPLAKGRAARPWGEQTARSSSDAVAKAFDRDVDKPVVDAIQKVAEARDVPMAQVALAWVLSKPVVSCPIVGATKPSHLRDAVAALDINLTDGEISELEEHYSPQDNYWW
jgi:aryl-alcohol dehydrogenase-like predicted oxidoreductase